MRIIGCDLHARQQTLAILDVATGEIEQHVLEHEGSVVRDFYAGLEPPLRVVIEATGSMHWFLEVMHELGVECQVGHPGACEPRKQKHDRRDAMLLLNLLAEDRFPKIWMPTVEQRDVRELLLYRHQWVRIRVRVQNALQSIALSHGLRRGTSLWSRAGLEAIGALALPPYARERRDALVRLVSATASRDRRAGQDSSAVASDSPSLPRSVEAAPPSASSTFSFDAAVTCSRSGN
jgi:transposase